jgi:branched-chain amino acid transport system permease protein
VILAFDTELFIQRLVDGLSKGSIYALLALALVVVFRGSGQLNFAQGEMALVTTYIGSTLTLAGWPVWLTVLACAVTGFVMGGAVERFLIRPMEAKSPFAVVVVAIGLFLGFNSISAAVWGVDARDFPSLFPNQPDDFFNLLGANVRWERVGIFFVLLGIGALLYLLFTRTKIGLAMRAVANTHESAQLVGIRVGRVLVFGWGLAAAIGAVAGCLIAPSAGLSLSMMFGLFIYGSAAATLGGLDSPLGAVVAGLALGLLDSMIIGYVDIIGGDLLLTVILGLILLVLLVKPSGLFGSTRVERV